MQIRVNSYHCVSQNAPCKATRRVRRAICWLLIYVAILALAAVVVISAIAFFERAPANNGGSGDGSVSSPQSITPLNSGLSLLVKLQNASAISTTEFNDDDDEENKSTEDDFYSSNRKKTSRIPDWRLKRFKWARSKAATTKLILLWTPYFSDPNWYALLDPNNGPIISGYSSRSSSSCFLSTDKSLIDQASSVIFHGRDMADPSKGLPAAATRGDQQKYVFYLLESPIHSPLNEFADGSDMWLKKAPRFDWTMTYNGQLADVHMPMIEFLPKKIIKSSANDGDGNSTAAIDEERIKGFAASFARRKYDALWIVSNCGVTHSRREHLVNHLKLLYGITVNVVGRCNNNPKEWEQIYQPEFASQHRFYFAFENSLCEEYMTEKAFNAYNFSRHFGLIPVVLGAGKEAYLRNLPNGSYVNVDAFAEIYQLSSVLHGISRMSVDQLLGYYQWQLDYELDGENHMVKGFRRLCDKLWTTDDSSISSSSSTTIKVAPKTTTFLDGNSNATDYNFLNFRNSMGKCSMSNWFANLGAVRWDTF